MKADVLWLINAIVQGNGWALDMDNGKRLLQDLAEKSGQEKLSILEEVG